MKTAYKITLAVITFFYSQHLYSAEITQEEQIVDAMVTYVEKVDGLSINWVKSIAETAKIARNNGGGNEIILAFLVKGDQNAMSPPLALLKNSGTHHEAINSTVEDEEYEFIWPAAAINPDGSWDVIVSVRSQNPSP